MVLLGQVPNVLETKSCHRRHGRFLHCHPQFFARRPSLSVYIIPLCWSLYIIIYPPWTYGYLWRHIRWPPHPCPLSHSNGVRMNSFRAPSRRPTGTWKPENNKNRHSWALQLCSMRWLGILANVNTPQTHAFAKSSQIRWKKSPLWAALSGWRLAIFVTLRAFSQVGETEDIGNHRPSDNQIRYDPPESGAANPDSTPFSALKTAAQGHLGLRNSRNP